MTKLSVNVNKIAVLRNSRGGQLPDPAHAARVAIEAGADGITVHPRPDLRHIRPDDVAILRPLAAAAGVEFNIEGNPYAGPSSRYPGFIEMVLAARPEQATLVPDTDSQLTSDHGWDLRREAERLGPLIARLKAAGIRVSLFMDADSEALDDAAALGADRIEIYTGPFALACESGDVDAALAAVCDCARRARAAGLGINAGHDLNRSNLVPLLGAVPDLLEVSIGHALIGEAVYEGLAAAVRDYQRVIGQALRR